MRHDERGFTLMELMVVVAVLAVLIAFAVPTFIGMLRSSQDRAAQAEVRDVLLAERLVWLDSQAYTDAAADLVAVRPGSVIAADPAAGVAVDVNDGDDDVVCLVRRSETGTHFSIWEHALQGTFYGTTDLTGADCPAVLPLGYGQGGW